jgi:predicted CXXCH cytochrome family protein
LSSYQNLIEIPHNKFISGRTISPVIEYVNLPRKGETMKKYMVFTILLGLIFMPYMALARVFGVCSNCHTMHASQTTWPGLGDKSKLPQGYLLATVCVGCHSSATSSTYYDLDGCKVPVVFYTGGSGPSSYLAGGNFWWVSPDGEGNDTKGHNIFSGHGDQNLNEAPGNWMPCANSCHISLTHQTAIPGLGSDCQSCHLNVKHHANDHLNGESGLVNSADQGWYRFLSGHMSGNGHGVEGWEDGVWEAGLHDGGNHQGETEHNEYQGWEGQFGSSAGFYNLGSTMTAFCCGCHGNFHKEQGGGWIRHPSDAFIIQDPANPGEYADTGGASHLYDPLSPVARPSLSDPPTNPGNVSPSTDMVMCLSCHRPHGSPYPDMLRWDYTAQQAGGDGDDKGCFYCHTQKND